MTKPKEQAFRFGDIVRILKYPEKGINGYGRVAGHRPDGHILVVNYNMPFQGSVNAYFEPKELRLRSRRVKA